MAAEMWRVPVSKVVQKGRFTFIQDNGRLQPTKPSGKTHNYLFTEREAGVLPLVLIGAWHEVIAFLATQPTVAIENRLTELPDIYMGACFYRPGVRFKGLFPVGDAIEHAVRRAAGDAVASDAHNAAAFVLEKLINLFKRKKDKPETTAPVAVTFTYLNTGDVQHVGTGTVTFATLEPLVRKALMDVVGKS